MKPKSLFASRVQGYRKMGGMTPADLAAAMCDRGHEGWTEYSVIGVENDRRTVDVYELNALADALDASRDDLVPPDQLTGGVTGTLPNPAADLAFCAA